MKYFAVTWLVAVLCCSAFAGIVQAQDKDDSTIDTIRKQTEEKLDAAKKFTIERKQEYEKKMEGELNDLSRSIGDLKDKAQTAKGEALVVLEAKMAELKEKQKVAEKKLDELRTSSAKTWEDMKKGAEKAYYDLKKAYDALGKYVQ